MPTPNAPNFEHVAPTEKTAVKTAPPQALRGLLPFLRPYRWVMAMALGFLVLAAVTTLIFPVALRALIDGGLSASSSANLSAQDVQMRIIREHFGLLFLVAMALGLFSAFRYFWVSWLGERVTADIRNAVYAHVVEQSPQFFEETQTGEVLSRLTADTTLVQTVVGSSLSMGLRNGVMGLGAFVVLVWTNPLMMVKVVGALLLFIIPVMLYGRRVRKLSRASQDKVADSSAIAAEVLNAIPVVQSYTAEQREAKRYQASTEQAFTTAIRRTKARALLVASIIIITSAGLLWGLYLGTQSVMAGEISAGQLGQTVIYVLILASAFAVLGEVYGDVLRAAGATERLMELLHHQSPITSPSHPLPLPVNVTGNAANKASLKYSAQQGAALEFANLQFHYPSRPTQPALTHFTLNVASGQTVALVGASGAGKTTVFSLLLRYYDPLAGAIRINGTPIQQLSLQNLRSMMALVPQDAVIFSTSALENIRYGRHDASDEAVHEAAKLAYADEFIERLPEGYDTFLGERGVRLSGGQRQRIAIARAILKNAPLLLLDEATSALDAQSEQMVQAALASAMQHRTTLVIAHRLATVQKADHLVVLEQGKIVEQGTHANLIAAGGAYAKLAALQFTA